MTFVPAPPHPQYSGNYIPQLFAKKVLVKYYQATVLAAISNTDYQGVISGYGDTVVIRTRPDIEVRDYVPGMTLQRQYPNSDPVTLYIDKAKYTNFVVDDISRAQADISIVDDWSTDASEKMKIAIDEQVLDDINDEVDASNQGATAGVKTGAFNLGTTGAAIVCDKTNFVDYVVHLGTVLDEANIPETGRWLVIPPIFANLIKRSELKDASLSGDGTSMLRNGRIGMLDRFTLYQSNAVPDVSDGGNTCYYIMAGIPAALTFALQVTKSETMRSEQTFGDLIRTLSVYGYKVVKPDAMALLYCRPDLT